MGTIACGEAYSNPVTNMLCQSEQYVQLQQSIAAADQHLMNVVAKVKTLL